MSEIKILSYEEEKKLNPNKKKEYYSNLKKMLTQEPVKFIDKVHIGICEALNGTIIKKIINKLKGYDLQVIGIENIPTDGPVIYASTHQDYNDHFNLVLSIPEHAIILNTTTVTPFFKFLMWFNGIVYVDRTDKKSRFNSKLELMKYLSSGKSVAVFPEGTFNCSPNKLVLPLHPGIFDIARKMNVPIVPMIQEYKYDPNSDNYKKNVKGCVVQFGKPIYVRSDDIIQEKMEELVEQFASIRYSLMENKGEYIRKFISNTEYINFVNARYKTWKSCKVNIDEERKTIKDYDLEKNLFTKVNDVVYDENGIEIKNEAQRQVEELAEKHFKVR